MFNGHRFEIGRASGAGCNCLIDTLMQKLLLVANVPAVRKRLREQFPRGEYRVMAGNYLDFRVHWEAIIRALGESAQGLTEPINTGTFSIVCVDLTMLGQGDRVGNGPVFLHIARTGMNHFVPLIPR